MGRTGDKDVPWTPLEGCSPEASSNLRLVFSGLAVTKFPNAVKRSPVCDKLKAAPVQPSQVPDSELCFLKQAIQVADNVRQINPQANSSPTTSNMAGLVLSCVQSKHSPRPFGKGGPRYAND